MKAGAVIRRFIEQHIIADDPYPERTRLDQQDMPLVQLKAPVAAAGLPWSRFRRGRMGLGTETAGSTAAFGVGTRTWRSKPMAGWGRESVGRRSLAGVINRLT